MNVFPTVRSVGLCFVALGFCVQTPALAQDIGLCIPSDSPIRWPMWSRSRTARA